MENIKNKKEQILLFFIILSLAIILCGIFLKFHMITDTYWNIGRGYEEYRKTPLKDGRIINYISLSVANSLNIPFRVYQFIMMLGTIIIYSLSVYIIYNCLIQKLKNKKNEEEKDSSKIVKTIIFIASFLTIFNPVAVEAFAYTEIVISLSIYLYTKAAIILNKNEKFSILKSIILIILGILSYQGTVNFFITLSIFLFIIEGKKNIKQWIKYLLKIGIISFIALIIMISVLNISNYILGTNQTRIGNNNISILDRILGITVKSLVLIANNKFNLFPRYLIISYIAITVILIFLQNNKTKVIFKYLFFIAVSVLSCTIPIYLQKTPIISPRMSFSIGSIIGLSINYIIFNKNQTNKKIDILLLSLGIISILINLYDYINIGMMNIKTKEQEEIYVKKIEQCIAKYEKENNIEVKKASFAREKTYKDTYCNMPSNTFTSKAINASYSNIHCINYYTNRNLEKETMDIEIYKKFREKSYGSFNEEQIKFIGDTVYICIY